MRSKQALRIPRLVACALSLASHGLLLLLLFYATKTVKPPSQTSSRNTELVFVLERDEPAPRELRIERKRLDSAPTVASVPHQPSTRAARLSTNEENVTTPVAPQVDWQLEAEAVAQRKAPALLEELRKKCARPEGIPPAECRPRNFDFEWNPEPKRAGFAGALPYVRLGKRCVVGLGFFGCAIGDLPQPNGDLFEHMRDPDRPRSSVPEP